MNKENIIKRINENFEDIESVLITHNVTELIRLFREYTDEIIKIIKEEM